MNIAADDHHRPCRSIPSTAMASGSQWRSSRISPRRGFASSPSPTMTRWSILANYRRSEPTHGVHVLPGVEMTTNWRGRSAHLLCYAAEFSGDALGRLARATVANQLANTHAVYEELRRRGYHFRARG